jgi:protein AbiQ
MDKNLNFYNIDANYIDYLSKFDTKDPKVDYSDESTHDKFLCGIVLKIGNNDYFAPISSFHKHQPSNIVIKDSNGQDVSSIRFSFMIPVPDGVASVKRINDEPSLKYRNLLYAKLQFCQQHATLIYNRAKHVYNATVVYKDPLMVKNCCNFKALEDACAKYNLHTI